MSELVFATIAVEIRKALSEKITDPDLVELLYKFVANPLDRKRTLPGEYIDIDKSKASKILNRKVEGGNILVDIQKRAYNELVLENIEENVKEKLFAKMSRANKSTLINNLIRIIQNDKTMEEGKKRELLSYAGSENEAKFVGQALLYTFTVPNVPEDLIALNEFVKRFSGYLCGVKYKPQRKTREQWIRWLMNDDVRIRIEKHIQMLQFNNDGLRPLLLKRFENERAEIPVNLATKIKREFDRNKDSIAILLLFLWSVYGENISSLSFMFADDDNYLTVSNVQIPKVYNCNKLGKIQTHGEIVPGFKTSYILENGELIKEREKLGDWHIRASRYCYTKFTTWYELYDAWDNDYYGWVSEDYLLWE